MHHTNVELNPDPQLHHVSFRSGLRTEVQAANDRELFDRLSNPNYLPSIEEWRELLQQPNGSQHFFQICNDRKYTQYEVLTKEYVEQLVEYLKLRRVALEKDQLRVLEVGAGNGRLSEMLRRVAGQAAGIEFIASDSGAWGIPKLFPVLGIDISDALKELSPDLVLFSWMPADLDLTGELRRNASHHEFILIGDRSCCGTNEAWEACDRYQARELLDLSDFQLCRNDRMTRHGELLQHSTTVSFRRGNASSDPAPGAALRRD